MRLRHTARAMAAEVLHRLGWGYRVEDRTEQHGVLDIAVSHVDMARVITGDEFATVLLYTADGDYRLRIYSALPLEYELEAP